MDEFAKKFNMKMQMKFIYTICLKLYKITHIHNEMW